MYEFMFYFLYGILKKYKDDDAVFTAVLGVFLMITIHLLALAAGLKFVGVIENIPVFSKVYLFNKLYCYLPLGVLLAGVYLYFNKSRTSAVIAKYSAMDDFYSFANVLKFLLAIVVPAVAIGVL